MAVIERVAELFPELGNPCREMDTLFSQIRFLRLQGQQLLLKIGNRSFSISIIHRRVKPVRALYDADECVHSTARRVHSASGAPRESAQTRQCPSARTNTPGL